MRKIIAVNGSNTTKNPCKGELFLKAACQASIDNNPCLSIIVLGRDGAIQNAVVGEKSAVRFQSGREVVNIDQEQDGAKDGTLGNAGQDR